MSLPENPENPQYAPPQTRLERVAEYIRSTGRSSDTLQILVRDWIDGPFTRHIITVDAVRVILEVDGALIPTLTQFTDFWLDEVRIAVVDGRAKRLDANL